MGSTIQVYGEGVDGPEPMPSGTEASPIIVNFGELSPLNVNIVSPDPLPVTFPVEDPLAVVIVSPDPLPVTFPVEEPLNVNIVSPDPLVTEIIAGAFGLGQEGRPLVITEDAYSVREVMYSVLVTEGTSGLQVFDVEIGVTILVKSLSFSVVDQATGLATFPARPAELSPDVGAIKIGDRILDMNAVLGQTGFQTVVVEGDVGLVWTGGKIEMNTRIQSYDPAEDGFRASINFQGGMSVNVTMAYEVIG